MDKPFYGSQSMPNLSLHNDLKTGKSRPENNNHKQSCCDALFVHVHCERCGEPSPDAWLCIKCFYAEREHVSVE